MIKKARDVKLGDWLGGKVVVTIYDDEKSLDFITTYGNVLLGGIDGEHEVWVDDPAPCCKPISLVSKKSVDKIAVGDLAVLRVDRITPHENTIITFNFGKSVIGSFWSTEQLDVLVGGDNEIDVDRLSQVLS